MSPGPHRRWGGAKRRASVFAQRKPWRRDGSAVPSIEKRRGPQKAELSGEDNAAMIGCQGYYEWKAGHTAGLELNAYATRDIALG